MENNLIKQYCYENPVAIRFSSSEHLKMIAGLFDRQPSVEGWTVGYVTFYGASMNIVDLRMYNEFYYPSYTIITAKEFFDLALPNRSILEYLK